MAFASQRIGTDNALHVGRQTIETLCSFCAVTRRRTAFLGHLRDALDLHGDIVRGRGLLTDGGGDFLNHLDRAATALTDVADGLAGLLRALDALGHPTDDALHTGKGIAGTAAHGIDGA